MDIKSPYVSIPFLNVFENEDDKQMKMPEKTCCQIKLNE